MSADKVTSGGEPTLGDLGVQPRPLEEFLAVLKASAIGVGSDIVSTDQHEAMGIEQASVQLLGSSEFYHLPVRLKYSNQGRLGEITRLDRILQCIHRDDA